MMFRRRYALIAASAVVAGVAFVSCKGRTTDKVERTGGMMEVVVPMDTTVNMQ